MVDQLKGLGPLPKLHKRERIVTDAANELRMALNEIIKKHDLTFGEELRMLSEVFGGHLSSIAKYAIRRERHGRTDRPGGLE